MASKACEKLDALKWFYHLLIRPYTKTDDLPCEWCVRRGDTTNKTTWIDWIWCNTAPKGHFDRVCKGCGESCAGG